MHEKDFIWSQDVYGSSEFARNFNFCQLGQHLVLNPHTRKCKESRYIVNLTIHRNVEYIEQGRRLGIVRAPHR